MNWDLSYLLQHETVALITAIFVPVYLTLDTGLPKSIKKYFTYLAALLFLDGFATYIDHVLSLAPDNRFELTRLCLAVLSYCSRPLMLLIVLFIILRSVKCKHRRLMALPLLVTFLCSMSAFFTAKVLYIDDDNALCEGPYALILYMVLIVYYALVIWADIKYLTDRLLERWLIFAILFILFIDGVLTLVIQNIDMHEQVEAVAITMYFTYFLASYHNKEVDVLRSEITETEESVTKEMLYSSIEILASTIDVSDTSRTGHSYRVAKYAQKIAQLTDRDEEACRNIYLAGLVHDIGIISIDDTILNKFGSLTPEEYEIVKDHPIEGGKFLSKLKNFPYLQDGARYHHENYDGTGYPYGLKGEEIPEVARIIAVADAYDAMTSLRPYREVMDQAMVKQEIWKGAGTRFDPHFAKLMISIIDADLDYELREKVGDRNEFAIDAGQERIAWDLKEPEEIKSQCQVMQETSVWMLGKFAFLVNHWADPTEAVAIRDKECSVSFFSKTNEDGEYLWLAPVAIVYTTSEGRVRAADYAELAVFESHGYSWRTGEAIAESSTMHWKPGFSWDQWIAKNKEGMRYVFTAHREAHNVYLTLDNELMTVESHLLLPEGFDKDVYMSISGERCYISDVQIG